MSDQPTSPTQSSPTPNGAGQPAPQTQPPPTTIPSSEATTPPKPKKWLLPTFIGVVVIALIAAGYFAYQNFQLKKAQTTLTLATPTPASSFPSPTTDPTANWETFISDKLGIQLKYPPGYFIVDSNNNQFRVQNFDPATAPARGFDPQQDSGKELITVVKEDVLQSLTSTDQVIETVESLDSQEGETTITVKEITNINGFNVIRAETKKPLDSTPTPSAYFINGTGDVISLYTGLDIQATTPTFNQILSTFKFLDSEETKLRTCPDTWTEFFSPIQELNNPYYGQKGQFITTDNPLDLIPVENFDLDWIRKNCEVNSPEPVG